MRMDFMVCDPVIVLSNLDLYESGTPLEHYVLSLQVSLNQTVLCLTESRFSLTTEGMVNGLVDRYSLKIQHPAGKFWYVLCKKSNNNNSKNNNNNNNWISNYQEVIQSISTSYPCHQMELELKHYVTASNINVKLEAQWVSQSLATAILWYQMERELKHYVTASNITNVKLEAQWVSQSLATAILWHQKEEKKDSSYAYKLKDNTFGRGQLFPCFQVLSHSTYNFDDNFRAMRIPFSMATGTCTRLSGRELFMEYAFKMTPASKNTITCTS